MCLFQNNMLINKICELKIIRCFKKYVNKKKLCYKKYVELKIIRCYKNMLP